MVLSWSLSLEVITKSFGPGTEKGASLGAPGDSRRPGAEGSAGRRLPGALGKASERLGIAHGDVGQHLAVDLDLGQLQPVHELAVRHAVLTRGGVDARDPQAAEVTLLVAP